MGKKSPPQQVISVTITSNIPQFVHHQISKCRAHVNETWHDVLKKHKLVLDPKVYCLKTRKADVLLINEKIGEYVAQYTRKREDYKLKIAKISKLDEAKIAEKKRKTHVPKRQPSPSKKQHTHAAEIKKAGPSPKKRGGSNITLAPEKRPRFEEDLIGPPSLTIFSNERNLGFDFDDSASLASQESQDSQDPGDDIKTQIVDKILKCVSNGDMHRIRQELVSLKEKQKFMKVSRYIPTTLNMLQYIFVE